MGNPQDRQPRQLTRRDFLGVFGAGGLAAAACAPGAQPIDTDHPKTTPSNALRIGPTLTPQPTTEPTSTPKPTETPKPIEKGIVGEWRLLPLSFEETGSGNKQLRVIFAAQNRSRELKNTLALTYNNVEFRVRTSDGFTYPHPQQKAETGSPPRLYIPPNYQFPYGPTLSLPPTAKDLQLVMTSRMQPGQTTIWTPEDFPPTGQSRHVEFFPQHDPGLKQLGEPIDSNNTLFTALEVKQARNERDKNWVFLVRGEAENRYGYTRRVAVGFQLLFPTGERSWSDFISSPLEDSGGPDLVPGAKRMHVSGGSRNETLPEGSRLLSILQYYDPDRREPQLAWAVYDLGKVPIGTIDYSGRIGAGGYNSVPNIK